MKTSPWQLMWPTVEQRASTMITRTGMQQMKARIGGAGLALAFLLAMTGGLAGWSVQAAGSTATVPAVYKPAQSVGRLPGIFKSPGGCKWTVLYFYSPHCGACQRIKPWIETTSRTLKDTVQFAWVDVSNPVNEAYAQSYQVQFTPSYLVFKPNGQAALDMTRELDHDYLQSFLQKTTSPKSGKGSC